MYRPVGCSCKMTKLQTLCSCTKWTVRLSSARGGLVQIRPPQVSDVHACPTVSAHVPQNLPWVSRLPVPPFGSCVEGQPARRCLSFATDRKPHEYVIQNFWLETQSAHNTLYDQPRLWESWRESHKLPMIITLGSRRVACAHVAQIVPRATNIPPS